MPDVVIVLKSSLDIIKERICKRKREDDKCDIDKYTRSLNNYYEHFETVLALSFDWHFTKFIVVDNIDKSKEEMVNEVLN